MCKVGQPVGVGVRVPEWNEYVQVSGSSMCVPGNELGHHALPKVLLSDETSHCSPMFYDYFVELRIQSRALCITKHVVYHAVTSGALILFVKYFQSVHTSLNQDAV